MAGLYPASLGRPNVPVAILVSLSVLKEMFDLTDEALMGSFRFDLRFHYAPSLTLEETGISLRTLENFRARVVGATFDEVLERMIETLGLNTGRQRHDSTHFRCNTANLTRLGRFTRTLERPPDPWRERDPFGGLKHESP
ncbi:MAG: transposase [Magnetococcales bacterium]|nr:transposase [Magnetococcales bacterium]